MSARNKKTNFICQRLTANSDDCHLSGMVRLLRFSECSLRRHTGSPMFTQAAEAPFHSKRSYALCGVSRGGETDMGVHPKPKAHQDDSTGGKRRRLEQALDEALANTFPASDPVSIEQPTRKLAGSKPPTKSNDDNSRDLEEIQ